MFNFKVALLLILASSLTSAQTAVPNSAWRTKPPAQWTEQEAQQVLTNSPWAKEISAGIAGRLTEDQLREGGKMGQPHGVGFDGVDPKGSARASPRTITLRLCWESALPVRLAELKGHKTESPTMDGDGYELAVYGIPDGNSKDDPEQLGEPLKKDAVLKRRGKKDVEPVRVEVVQRPEGIVVMYLFPLSAEITNRDGLLEFDAHIGRIYLTHTFELHEMEFLGKWEL